MQFISLVQRTPEWHAWRKNGITASESPIILGCSPYKTPWRLWAERTGRLPEPDLSRNPNVQRGVELEDEVRERFAVEHLDMVEPACGEWDENPVFRASFDGLTSDNTPVEIKCPSESVFKDVLARGTESEAYRLYSVQVQHQMLVAGASHGWLVFYCAATDEMREFDIPRDDHVISRIIIEGLKFFDCVVNNREPPLDPERDVYLPKSEADAAAWRDAAGRYIALQREINALKAKIADLQEAQAPEREKISSLMGDFQTASFAGVSVRHSVVKGRVDYKAFLEAEHGGLPSDEELEPYRSEDSHRWTFNCSTSEKTPDFSEKKGSVLEDALEDDPRLTGSASPFLGLW